MTQKEYEDITKFFDKYKDDILSNELITEDSRAISLATTIGIQFVFEMYYNTHKCDIEETNESTSIPRWRKIKCNEYLPCRAYLYELAYERDINFLGKCHVDGFLMPNEPGQVGCDTWYLPVDEIKNLPKEK